MKPFTEELRYEYPLTNQSIVLDIGCHKGTFSRILSEKYGCKILAFEPIQRFYDEAVATLKDKPNVQVFKCGVGATTRTEQFGIKGDMTGAFAEGDKETVDIVSWFDLLDDDGPPSIDLIKINIEGGEFELLEDIIDLESSTLFKNIQVQFHPVVPDYQKRYDAIRAALLKTHRLTYDAPWCWENYERI